MSTSDTAAPRLTVYVRYADLVAAGIVSNYSQLIHLIDREGFPGGVLLAPNTRAFELHLVQAWLASRPTARRGTPHRTKTKAAVAAE